MWWNKLASQVHKRINNYVWLRSMPIHIRLLVMRILLRCSSGKSMLFLMTGCVPFFTKLNNILIWFNIVIINGIRTFRTLHRSSPQRIPSQSTRRRRQCCHWITSIPILQRKKSLHRHLPFQWSTVLKKNHFCWSYW